MHGTHETARQDGCRIRFKNTMLKKNIIGLTWIQLISYVAPIVALPILTRNLGLHDFGLYIFYSGIANLVAILADMGVGNIATQRVVLANTREEKATYYLAIMGIKSGFLILSVFCLYFITKFFFTEQYSGSLFVLAALGGASLALTPSFYYLATGDSVKLAAVLSIGKAVFLLALILLATGGINLHAALLVTFLPGLCATFAANLMVVAKIDTLKEHFSLEKTKEFFVDSRVFALSNLMVWSYTSSPALLIAKFYGTESAALYGAAEKIIVALKSLLSPVQQGAHPWVLSALNENRSLYKKRALGLLVFLITFGLTTTAFLYAGADEILYLLGKGKLTAAHGILIVMGALPLLTSLTGFLGNFVLIPLGLNRIYLASIAVGFFTYVLLYFTLGGQGAMGTVYAMVSAELAITIVMAGAILFRAKKSSLGIDVK